MSIYDEEWERHIAELQGLLVTRDLSPDTRARGLTALIEAKSAQLMHTVSETLTADTMPLFSSAVRHFGDKVDKFGDNY